jgi:hypothetical protein
VHLKQGSWLEKSVPARIVVRMKTTGLSIGWPPSSGL